MKLKTVWLALLIAGLAAAAGGKDRDDNKDKKPSRDKSSSATRSSSSDKSDKPGQHSSSGGKSEPGSSPLDRTTGAANRSSAPAEPAKSSKETGRHGEGTHSVGQGEAANKPINNGAIKSTPPGQVKKEIKSDGEHTRQFSSTGRVQKEVVQRKDGTQETIHYAANGRMQKSVVVERDGARATTQIHYDRNGRERTSETIKVDARGREVSKTVVVKQTTVLVRNTTIVNNTTIVRNYDRCRYGFVYRPVYVVHSPVFVSWYDPYWYSPSGVLVVHPFHYSWGWEGQVWYRHHHHYWATYEVYPAPCYWVTDWLIAGYIADRYAVEVSAAQAREDARLAREDAERARQAAAQAHMEAEIADARAAQREAEARLAQAEARAAKAEAAEARGRELTSRPNPNATPIDPETKETLRIQVERTIAEKKEFADQASKGRNPVPPDVSQALADPKHVYPVSSSVSVISASDQSPAGVLTEGDLLRVEPGQEKVLKNADENTFITMRVMTSKGEDGEVKAGTLVSIPLKTLQDFDSEFRAKLDLGLAEADKNHEQFKTASL